LRDVTSTCPVRVLEHHQPVAVRLAAAQRVAYRAQCPVDVPRLRQAEPLRKPHEGGSHPGGLLGRNPPHQLVRVGVPVRVLDRQLGAAGPAELMVGRRKQHHRTVAEHLTHLGEQGFTADETGITRRQSATDRHRAISPLVRQLC
jgi:hypothetical protein